MLWESNNHQGKKAMEKKHVPLLGICAAREGSDLSSTIHKYLKQWGEKNELGSLHSGASLGVCC